uniref:hypothetical protein n=1 Tax=Algoriphagus sp. TaxID=1872435 RepID=UPI004047823C
MKKRFVLAFLLVIGSMAVQAQEMTTQTFNEWKIVTVVESIVPMGLGRSRMVENMTDVNTEDFRTSREDGKTSSQRSVSRKELKVDKFDEAKLLNFFSATGINFQNIASNDAMIAARIMELESEGFTLAYVTSAVESVGGKDDDSGIFISRMYFKKSLEPR